jgi:hypothetical protein
MTAGGRGWQVKAELEWADVPNGPRSLLPGWRWSDVCWWVVNSNGVANDPQRRDVRYGGMVLTAPYSDPDGLAGAASELLGLLRPVVNYRCGMRISVHIPGLSDSLEMLRRLADYTRRHLPPMWSAIDPLKPLLEAQPGTSVRAASEFQTAAMRKRHYLVSERCHAARMTAPDVPAFLAAETPPGPGGKPARAPVIREALDLRDAGTGWVSMRCFAQARTPGEIAAAAGFATSWLLAAINGSAPQQPVVRWMDQLPRQLPFNAQLEKGWRYTNFHDNSRRTVLARLATLGVP